MRDFAEIPLGRGRVALVSAEDYDRVAANGPWHSSTCTTTGRNYARRQGRDSLGNKVDVTLHKFLTGWEAVNHLNRDMLDNRRENLRPTNSQLMSAVGLLSKANTSGYRGVTFWRARGVWKAQIKVERKNKGLGYYKSAKEAALAYDEAARKEFGAYASLNFPKEGEVGCRADVPQ